MIGHGWIGGKRAVLHYLAVVGADRAPDGRFLVVGSTGDAPTSFMGDPSEDAEVVIPAGCCYLVGGVRKSLAAGLGGTSSGMSICVIS